MQVSPELFDALNAVYPLLLTLKEQAHKQENRYEAARLKKLAAWFDRLGCTVHAKLIHPLVDWFAETGRDGESDSTIGTITLAEVPDPAEAFAATLAALEAIHKAYEAACEAAEDSGQYTTVKMIWKALKKVEKWQEKAEAEAAHVKLLGVELYLQKMK